jgi:hypothetical protein
MPHSLYEHIPQFPTPLLKRSLHLRRRKRKMMMRKAKLTPWKIASIARTSIGSPVLNSHIVRRPLNGIEFSWPMVKYVVYSFHFGVAL